MNSEPDMYELREGLGRILGEAELERVLAMDTVELEAYLADEQQLRQRLLREAEYQRWVARNMLDSATGSVQ